MFISGWNPSYIDLWMEPYPDVNDESLVRGNIGRFIPAAEPIEGSLIHGCRENGEGRAP